MPKSDRVSLKVGDPVPSSIGRCADAYHDVRELRLAMEKEVAPVKQREAELLGHMIDSLSTSDDTGASGLRYKVQIVTSEQPTVTDWDALHDFVYDNDRFDLMSKSISTKAVKEMFEAGEKIPGVSQITVKKASITKI